MVWVDIAVIILLAHYAINGILSGCKKEIFSIAVLVLGIIIAWFFSYDFTVFLQRLIGSTTTKLALSFLLLVALTICIGKVINWLLTEKNTRGFSALDRIGGLFLGVVHGWILMIALVLIAGLTALPKDRWWRQSKYLPTLQAAAITVKSAMDTKMASSINYR